ncbi:D-alanine--D-alanine ligase [Sediminibacterium goheungense]|uniref:D-alanine--D-alanine ligase n=1 Tax=Sediminibacterium goheungense TaxID=1086393 RepID=A0A4R6J2F4_9BACT|nr:D-alanine--D-alanine ligase [Sediminibacterium goheungense]TDO28355.1 D-alanine-D-alanine ligase [Sediminibacterium goheungense]
MKKKLALVTGGLSGEAQISYKSAVTVGNHLDRALFDVYKIDINATGWWYENEAGEQSKVNRDDFSITDMGAVVHFDVVLLCIHGTPGEDGKLQGYFDMLGLPYTSCDAATSALTMNKRYTVAVASFSGINVAKSMHLFKHTPVAPATILEQLRLPVFVKPNSGGSSIGMSKVNTAEELPAALEKGFKEDSQLLVEEFISGREFTVGVFKSTGNIQVLPITEIETKNEFFDFEAKYQGKSIETTPAQINDQIKTDLETAAKRVYEVLNCRGVVRIDFIYDTNLQKPFMLEVNTVPGQSEASVIPQQVRAMGWSLKDFYTAVVNEAVR